MKSSLFFFIAAISCQAASAFDEPTDPLATPFEIGDGNDSADYDSAIDFYRRLSNKSANVRIDEAGLTDSGKPLHLVLVSSDSDFDVGSNRRKGRSVLLINNGIHPGETDGIDASMAFVRDLTIASDEVRRQWEHVLIAIIPVYNIGGALNRNSGTRANQNGPREYGFRGNARNYDLNRDFIKCDTRNARSFAKIFHRLDPDLLIDTHVTNGADYQHVMTTTHSQKDKLGGQLGAFFAKTFEPAIFADMESVGFPTIPYVNSGGSPPDEGFPQFLDSPRYSTGYAALFQTMGFMTETHMLKPYPQRVAATQAFLDSSLKQLAEHGEEIQTIRQSDRTNYHQQQSLPISWQLDRNNPSRLTFMGYEASHIASKVTPGNRLFYDRTMPFTKDIIYYNSYVPKQTVVPAAGYLIPAGWHDVMALMKLNKVEMSIVTEAIEVHGEQYTIADFTSGTSPYEGHFMHREIKLSKADVTVTAQPGDAIIRLPQQHARYAVEALEPAATDSLFRWNYFDTILQRKEHFSSYVFEESAAKMLQKDKKLRDRFEDRKSSDSEFAASRRAQLQWLYERSKHAEKAFRSYPVIRLKNVD